LKRKLRRKEGLEKKESTNVNTADVDGVISGEDRKGRRNQKE
jgi:hypothetical protein